MRIEVLKFDSKEQNEFVKIREKVLREPLGLKFSAEELALESEQHHFGIFLNDKLIGGLILVHSSNSEIKMRQVCLDFEFQNKGFGQELVRFSENWSKEINYKIIYCHARKQALNFYLKMNYSIEDEAFMEVGLEHFKLVKMLS